jgi:hypothetical protein
MINMRREDIHLSGTWSHMSGDIVETAVGRLIEKGEIDELKGASRVLRLNSILKELILDNKAISLPDILRIDLHGNNVELTCYELSVEIFKYNYKDKKKQIDPETVNTMLKTQRFRNLLEDTLGGSISDYEIKINPGKILTPYSSTTEKFLDDVGDPELKSAHHFLKKTFAQLVEEDAPEYRQLISLVKELKRETERLDSEPDTNTLEYTDFKNYLSAALGITAFRESVKQQEKMGRILEKDLSYETIKADIGEARDDFESYLRSRNLPPETIQDISHNIKNLREYMETRHWETKTEQRFEWPYAKKEEAKSQAGDGSRKNKDAQPIPEKNMYSHD